MERETLSQTKPNQMQRLRIDVTKIDKTALYKGAKGTYLDITLLDNRDGTDQYGNDGMIVQDIGKDRREAGEKGAILGNWRHVETRQPAPAQTKPEPRNMAVPSNRHAAPVEDEDEQDIPF